MSGTGLRLTGGAFGRVAIRARRFCRDAMFHPAGCYLWAFVSGALHGDMLETRANAGQRAWTRRAARLAAPRGAADLPQGGPTCANYQGHLGSSETHRMPKRTL